MDNNKRPKPERFREVVQACAGNLSKVARSFKVARNTVGNWMNQDPEFKAIVKDERSVLFDECLLTARVVALGIPAYEYEEYIDDDGNVKKRRRQTGWLERPDANMLRYLMEKLGKREEGFRDAEVEEDGIEVRKGVKIEAWIDLQNRGNEKEDEK